MKRLFPRAGALIAALAVAAPLFGAAPAVAQSCYSPREIRSAVQSGQVIPLKNAIAQVIGQLGGEIVSLPTLCDEGGQLVYRFTILSNGRTIPVAVDAQTGAPSY
jgi:hypothetical protein